MVAVFGLGERPQDDLVPPASLVEMNARVCVFQLRREGLLTVGIEVTIGGGDGHGGYHLAVHEAGKVEIDSQRIQLAAHPMCNASVFVCPACGRDCYRLHCVNGTWACRRCHRLDYWCRHRNRTIPGLARIRYLRRRINADPQPFSPLPRKSLRARKHLRICKEIRALEQALVEHAREDVAAVLERRHARSRS